MNSSNNIIKKLPKFDVIGDIHGCFNELKLLIDKLGYDVHQEHLNHPESRKIIFLGDLVDRGYATFEVVNYVIELYQQNIAYCVIGNHDDRFMRWLKGNDVQISHGLDDTIKQFSREFINKKKYIDFFEALPSYIHIQQQNVIAVHAAFNTHFLGMDNNKIRKFCMYGPTTKNLDSEGYPTRIDWTKYNDPKNQIVYGHTVYHTPYINNNCYGIDTGCVFGGKLTALRYPENVFVSVDALKTYYKK